MITTAEEYQKYLWQLQDQNYPVSAILLPSDENIYEIDLNTRIVNAPETLSVKTDHAAETIYFLVDRFYDNMDLSTAACVIQYINAKGDARFFPVPFYDVTTFSNTVMDQFVLAHVTETNYKINTYYIQDTNYNYILTSEEYDPTKTYYLKITPNLNKKYVHVELTADTYTPNGFYYIEKDTLSPNFGKYCQDTGSFNSQQEYFALIDRRYVQVSVAPKDYRKNYYYTINKRGQLELDSAGYVKTKNYFIFIDSPKMIFPWIISADVTEEEGPIEFSIRFYQIQPTEGEQIGVDQNNLPIYSYTYPFVYNLNTQPAQSQVLHGMPNILEQEAVTFDQSILAGLYSEIARLNSEYTLYWLEA